MSESRSTEERILQLAITALTVHLNEFIGACMDENGKPVAPPMKELMKARACLPAQFQHAFQPKEKK